MDRIYLKALAKINLGLDVLRKREDGYHEVKMIMQTISLYDELELRRIPQPEIRVETNIPYLPVNESNLAYKAAQLLRDEFGVKDGVFIRIKKKIPVSAGMAGGSTDGAAALWGVNRMFQLGLSRRDLMERGVKLGADVPYCLLRGTALAEGIGETLSRLPAMPRCYLLIAKPGVAVSTKFVYTNLDAAGLTPEQHPDVDAVTEALRRQDLKLLASRMGNVLETVTIPAYPVIEEIKQCMLEEGALGSLMSGSGPTVFGIFENAFQARKAGRAIWWKQLAPQTFVVRPFNVKA